MSVRIVMAFTLLTAAGCLPAETSPNDAGGGDTGGAVTYTKDIQPVFAVKCAPCHTGQSAGGHNIGTTYADALMPVNTVDAPAGCFMDVEKTMPKTIGECTLPAIMEGWMPMGMYCFNTPRPAACVSTAEQDVVAAWIAGGMKQ